MRISKEERRKNASALYSRFNGRVVIVADREESKTNPNINRCKLLACCSELQSMPMVIAESTSGKMFAFYELLQFISKEKADGAIKLLYDKAELNKYLSKNYGFYISYDDGYAIIIEGV